MELGLKGRVAVVTGGSKGIGLAIVRALAAEGALVVAGARSIDALEGIDGVLPVAVDLVATDGPDGLVGAALARFGRVDVLVNNAGISQPRGLLEISEDEWDLTVATNLKGAFNWCKAVAPTMLAQRAGRIVSISSVSAHTGAGTAAVSKFAYCAAKAGILGLTRGLAKELAPYVTVNAICPGLIETDLTSGMIAREGADTLKGSIPLARLGTPADIAEVVAFLATHSPTFMTGEVLDVDGGQWVN